VLKVGKDLATELKALPAKVEKGRNRFETELDALRDEVRKPLADWEDKETARISAHEKRILDVRAIANEAALHRSDVETLKAMLAAAEAVDLSPAATEEFADDYRLAKEAALHNVKAAITTRTKYDADQAELARLREAEEARQAQERIDAADRARVEREERIAREAAEKAEREHKDALERREREHKEALDRTQREEREAAAARERELQRQTDEANVRAAQAAADARARDEAAEQARRDDAAATAKRAADIEHRRKVNSAARDALIKHAILEKTAAEAAVQAIAKGLIPGVGIRY
jgi:hypothetical protein